MRWVCKTFAKQGFRRAKCGTRSGTTNAQNYSRSWNLDDDQYSDELHSGGVRGNQTNVVRAVWLSPLDPGVRGASKRRSELIVLSRANWSWRYLWP